MSKPDFFLPFHLPMVVPDDNPCNIIYKQNSKNEVLKHAIALHRVDNGCYQTIKDDRDYFWYSPSIRKMFPFSISLN